MLHLIIYQAVAAYLLGLFIYLVFRSRIVSRQSSRNERYAVFKETSEFKKVGQALVIGYIILIGFMYFFSKNLEFIFAQKLRVSVFSLLPVFFSAYFSGMHLKYFDLFGDKVAIFLINILLILFSIDSLTTDLVGNFSLNVFATFNTILLLVAVIQFRKKLWIFQRSQLVDE